MLDNAYKYEEEISRLFTNTWYDPHYQYYHGQTHQVFSMPEDDCNAHQFVSLDAHGKVIGHILYWIQWDVRSAYRLGAINFSRKPLPFALDLYKAIDNVFVKFGMNRLEFSCICGNPAETHYDRLADRLGGRIMCVRRNTAMLLDGTITNEKMYEILRPDYLAAKQSGFMEGQRG